MQRNMNTIQFESENEIQEVLNMIVKYMEQNTKENNNETLEEFFMCLDAMYIWTDLNDEI